MKVLILVILSSFTVQAGSLRLSISSFFETNSCDEDTVVVRRTNLENKNKTQIDELPLPFADDNYKDLDSVKRFKDLSSEQKEQVVRMCCNSIQLKKIQNSNKSFSVVTDCFARYYQDQPDLEKLLNTALNKTIDRVKPRSSSPTDRTGAR